jgi:hypothetical protein
MVEASSHVPLYWAVRAAPAAATQAGSCPPMTASPRALPPARSATRCTTTSGLVEQVLAFFERCKFPSAVRRGERRVACQSLQRPGRSQTSPHKPRLVVSHSTCPPLSSSPHAHSFVLGTAVINNNLVQLSWTVVFATRYRTSQRPVGARTRSFLCVEAQRKSPREIFVVANSVCNKKRRPP